MHDCHEDDSDLESFNDDMNHEIHPVYSIDVIQDFSLSPRPFADLTGVWNGIYGETWYTRQINNVLWALTISRDQGQTFSRVFIGQINNDNTITGDWVSIPLGSDNAGGSSRSIRRVHKSQFIIKSITGRDHSEDYESFTYRRSPDSRLSVFCLL